MSFEDELQRLLPGDIPQRDQLIEKAAEHLRLIEAANAYMNLTRITDAREAAIKHVCDCVTPWKHFAGAAHIVDAGTGAGFPGIPLSIVLPGTRFSLIESIQKKARFVESAVEMLGLANVNVFATRAEELTAGAVPDVITARAVAPIGRILELFQKPLRRGARLLLYKGPDVEAELKEAAHHRCSAKVISRYDLPENLGSRTIIEIRANGQRPPARERAPS